MRVYRDNITENIISDEAKFLMLERLVRNLPHRDVVEALCDTNCYEEIVATLISKVKI